jgi:hypothetical protein
MLPAKPMLIEVVPRLTPDRCGVSDFSLLIARELEAAFGIRTAFVVLNSSERCDVPFPVIYCAPAQLLDECESLSKGSPAVLLVHLSGYGYAPDGAPTALARALAEASDKGGFRIAVFFHELFAPALPWKSAFWHARRQKEALRRIAATGDLLATNTPPSLEWLEKVPNKKSAAPVQFLPVFSPVGEPKSPGFFSCREPVAAVFGLGGTRKRAYREMAGLGSTFDDLGVEEIWDIGEEIDSPRELHGIPIKPMGVLPAEQVGQRLAQARFGFIPLISEWLTKSTVFASYCAHGTIAILTRSVSKDIAGLRDGIHFLSPSTAAAARASGLEQCSRAAWSWYQDHCLHAHCATYARWLAGTAMGAGGRERMAAIAHGS